MERKHAKKGVLGVSSLAAVGAFQSVFNKNGSSLFNKVCNTCYAGVYGAGIGLAALVVGTVVVDLIFDKKEKNDKETEEAEDGIKEDDPADSAFEEE